MSAGAASARALAAHAVARILREGVTLDAALHAALAGAPETWAVRAFVEFRRRARLLPSRGDSRAAVVAAGDARWISWCARLLSVALFELEDARTPDYAVVDAAVKTAKATDAARARGLINAVLRRYLRERKTLDAKSPAIPRRAMPSPIWLADRLRADWPVRWTQLLAAGDTQAPMWLRVDSRRGEPRAYLEQLREAGIAARAEPRVPLRGGARRALRRARASRVRRGFGVGAGSRRPMRGISFALEAGPAGPRCLRRARRQDGADRRARAGARAAGRRRHRSASAWAGCGKTWALRRLQATVLAGDAGAPEAWWDGVPFDRILLDAPCSALGVIRRHPDIRLRKSPADIDKLPLLQARLLAAAWRMLAPGGRLVYATCTVTRSENRDLIGGFLRARPTAAVVPVEKWRAGESFGRGSARRTRSGGKFSG